MEGNPIVVNFRLILFNVSNVDTRDLIAQVHLGVVFYWTDRRLAGWSLPVLPPMLWGPDIRMLFTVGPDAAPDDETCALARHASPSSPHGSTGRRASHWAQCYRAHAGPGA